MTLTTKVVVLKDLRTVQIKAFSAKSLNLVQRK